MTGQNHTKSYYDSLSGQLILFIKKTMMHTNNANMNIKPIINNLPRSILYIRNVIKIMLHAVMQSNICLMIEIPAADFFISFRTFHQSG